MKTRAFWFGVVVWAAEGISSKDMARKETRSPHLPSTAMFFASLPGAEPGAWDDGEGLDRNSGNRFGTMESVVSSV